MRDLFAASLRYGAGGGGSGLQGAQKKKKNKGGEEKYLKKFLLKYLIFSSTNTTPQHTHTHPSTQILYTSVFLIKSFKVRKLKNAPVMRAL